MYEELLTRLRNCASDEVEDCVGCLYQNGYKGTHCMNGSITEAIEVIEELNRKVEELEAMREISPEAEYAINKHADNIISKLDKLINDSEDKPRWIPVTEKLPNAYDLVLATDGEEIGFAAYQQKGNYWLGNEGFDTIYPEITHWMLLPELPKD